MEQNLFFAVDIGGTKTEIAAFRSGDSLLDPVAQKRYHSVDLDGVEDAISDFTRRYGLSSRNICLGIAGVVRKDDAVITNLSWKVTEKGLGAMGFSRVCMINDMTALAASLPLLGGEDLVCLKKGSQQPGDVSAVLAPGTGLGEGFLLKTGNLFYPRGTEGGHTDFAPVGEEQQLLLQWLEQQRTETISYELVAAGPAIGTLYDFYLFRGEQETGAVRQQLQGVRDRTPAIIEAAVRDRCGLCRKAVALFLSILGREAANLIMKVYGTGGLYLGGGILPRLIDAVSFEPFFCSFHMPGTMLELTSGVPVNVITRKDTVLLGTACYGNIMFQGGEQK